MDKDRYYDETEARLTELRHAVAERIFPAPSTPSAAARQAANRQLRSEILAKVDEALAALASLRARPDSEGESGPAPLAALRAGSDTEWENDRAGVDQRVSEIEGLRTGFR